MQTPMDRWHLFAALLHTISAVVLAALTGTQGNPCIPIHTTFLSVNGTGAQLVLSPAGSVCPRAASILFALLAAADHWVTFAALQGGRPAFIKEALTKERRNWIRWAEYSVSSTIMVITIAALSGLVDLAQLVGVAGCNVSMILFGHLAEVLNTTKPPTKAFWRKAFWWGSLAGLGAWLPILVTFFGTLRNAATAVPVVVYFIIFGEMANFFVFAGVFFLQQRGIESSPDRAFETGEWRFVLASAVAKLWLTWFSYAAPTPSLAVPQLQG